MRSTYKKRIISWVMMLAMLFTLMPQVSVYAEETIYDWQGMGAEGADQATKIKMLDPSPENIKVLHTAENQRDCYINQIIEPVNGVDGVRFVFTMDSGMGSFGNGENFVLNSMPHITVLDENEENILASYDQGNLNFYAEESHGKNNETGDPGRIVIGTDKDVLEEGNYVLYFGAEICGNNTSKILGAPVKFKFTLETVPELSVIIAEAQSELGNALSYDESSDDIDKWGKYPESAKVALQEAISEASLNAEDEKEAARQLKTALKTFRQSVFVGIKSVVVTGFEEPLQVGEQGTATALVDSVPNDPAFKRVKWEMVENDGCISIDEDTGAWITNYPGKAVIRAVSCAGTSVQVLSEEKTVTVVGSQDGSLTVNVSESGVLQSTVQKAIGTSEITVLKVKTSNGVLLNDEDISYLRELNGLQKLDLFYAGCSGLDLSGNTSLTSVILPKSLEEIQPCAFKDCKGLKSIEIPASVERIAADAFVNCTALPDSIKVWGVEPPQITGTGELFAGTSVKTVNVPYRSDAYYKAAATWNMFNISTSPERKIAVEVTACGMLGKAVSEELKMIGLDESEIDTLVISTAGDAALARVTDVRWLQSNCLNITALDLSGAAMEDDKIKANYFNGRDKLKIVSLPEEIVNIGSSAFAGCKRLEDIVLPSALESIGNNAFQGCESLSSTIVCNAIVPPSFSGTLFGEEKQIRVPASSMSAYKRNVGWGMYSILPQIEIALNRTSASIEVPGTLNLNASVRTYGNSGGMVYWKVSDSSIIKLDKTSGTAVTVKGLKAGKADVIAYDISGNVQAACSITVKNMAAPARVTASRSSYNSIKISWSSVSGAKGYEVYRSTTSNGTYYKLKTFSASVNSYTDTGLTTGKTYYYKVRPYKVISDVTYRGEYSAAKSAKPYLTTPTAAAKRYSYSSNKISWNGILGATGYKVYRATSKNGTYSWIATKGKDVRSYIDTKRTTGKTYYYKVRAYRTVNKSPVYSAYSAVKYATPTLSKVATVKTAKAGTRKIKVTWSGVSGATGYKVYRSTKSTSGYIAVKTVKAGDTREYTSGKLTKNKRYYFKVRAYRVVNGKTVYGPYSTAVYRTAK